MEYVLIVSQVLLALLSFPLEGLRIQSSSVAGLMTFM